MTSLLQGTSLVRSHRLIWFCSLLHRIDQLHRFLKFGWDIAAPTHFSMSSPGSPSLLKSIPIIRVLCGVVALHASCVLAHGRLVEPPSRSSMWRYGFKNPPNYSDHQLYCGGLQKMIHNGGCGICGDARDEAPPRPNEAGGKFANGIIVRRYKTNQAITAKVELTVHHKGYFQFKICPINNDKVDPTQECFDRNVLHLVDGSGDKFYLPKMAPDGLYKMLYQLPERMGCSLCVIQWTYVAGNNWGRCENGTESLGCGPQETFRACADVSIGVELGSDQNDLETNEIPGSGASAAGHSAAILVLLVMEAILFLLKAI